MQPVARREFAPGADLYILPAPRFGALHLLVAFRQVLDPERVTRGALLPRVLRRGTRTWPDLPSLARHLDGLYGASVGAAAAKMGDHQTVELTYSCPGPEVLKEVLARRAAAAPSAGRGALDGPSPEGLLVHGAELLAEMFSRPAGPGGRGGSPKASPGGKEGLDEDYVREEKAGLGRDLRALADDRTSWAHHRCVEEMCRGEPYALHSLGRLPDLEGITGESLDAFRRELLARSPLSAYVVGPVDDRTVDRVSEALLPLAAGRRADDGAGSASLPASACHPLPSREPSREREVHEEADVEQARLVVGLATGTTLTDPAHPAQVLYNGLLGGFVHGRLFRRMREEAGLAYYVWSRVVALKGLIIISCGIREEDYGRALDIIRREVDSLARGRFSDREFGATRNSALAVARARLDSPSALVYGHLEHLAAGQVPDGIAPWRELEGVTAADVRDFARRPVIDTVYLLARGRRRRRPPGGGGSRAGGPCRAAG